jgi:hypothetical protein
MSSENLEWRLEEWARWCLKGQVVNGLYYSPASPGFSEFIKNDRAPLVADDREMEIERAVSTLAKRDPIAAEVIRAEYRAHPRYGNAHYEDSGNDCKRTHRQIGISERTYRAKLEKARDAIFTVIYLQLEVTG